MTITFVDSSLEEVENSSDEDEAEISTDETPAADASSAEDLQSSDMTEAQKAILNDFLEAIARAQGNHTPEDDLEPLVVSIDKISANGVLTLVFNKEMLVPSDPSILSSAKIANPLIAGEQGRRMQ